MKTIATAAAIMIMSGTAWAGEPKDQEQAATDEPIVLSEAEMDGITAGVLSSGSYTIVEFNTYVDFRDPQYRACKPKFERTKPH